MNALWTLGLELCTIFRAILYLSTVSAPPYIPSQSVLERNIPSIIIIRICIHKHEHNEELFIDSTRCAYLFYSPLQLNKFNIIVGWQNPYKRWSLQKTSVCYFRMITNKYSDLLRHLRLKYVLNREASNLDFRRLQIYWWNFGIVTFDLVGVFYGRVNHLYFVWRSTVSYSPRLNNIIERPCSHFKTIHHSIIMPSAYTDMAYNKWLFSLIEEYNHRYEIWHF